MIGAAYILVLIYSPLGIDALPMASLSVCELEAKEHIGKPLNVSAWDGMGGANPIPHVAAAFCAIGSIEKGTP